MTSLLRGKNGINLINEDNEVSNSYIDSVEYINRQSKVIFQNITKNLLLNYYIQYLSNIYSIFTFAPNTILTKVGAGNNVTINDQNGIPLNGTIYGKNRWRRL